MDVLTGVSQFSLLSLPVGVLLLAGLFLIVARPDRDGGPNAVRALYATTVSLLSVIAVVEFLAFVANWGGAQITDYDGTSTQTFAIHTVNDDEALLAGALAAVALVVWFVHLGIRRKLMNESTGNDVVTRLETAYRYGACFIVMVLGVTFAGDLLFALVKLGDPKNDPYKALAFGAAMMVVVVAAVFYWHWVGRDTLPVDDSADADAMSDQL